MPRATIDQAVVTGFSIAANHALVSLVQDSLQAVAHVAIGRERRETDDEAAWSRATLVADVAAIGAGVAIQRLFSQRHRERLTRSTARTGGFWLAVTGTAATVIGGLQELAARTPERRRRLPAVIPVTSLFAAGGELMRRRRERLDADLPPSDATVKPGEALGIGIAMSLAFSGISFGERALADAVARAAARVLPVDDEILRPVGHAVALTAIGASTRALIDRTFHRIESKEESVESAFDIPPPNPLVSGSFDSKVGFDTLSRQGRRFVWTVTPAARINELLDERGATPPIRAYVGLESAATEEARVALVLDELDRTQAFERQWILIDSPTGTGYVNYAAINALEVLTRGNCASIAMQYAARPSVLSLDRVEAGRKQARLLLDAIHQRLQPFPPERRPKLVLFGESLGAWSSQDAFVDRGTAGLVETGVDRSIWIGTPHFSKWKEQVLYDDRPDVDPALVGVFSSIDEWHAVDPAARDQIRYVMITHHNDGVALFGPELFVQAPEWLCAPDERPPTVPRAMRWVPTTTFFQVLVDMKNSANVVPGQFAASGHDYRADLLPFFLAALGIDASDEQLGRIARWLEQEELQRTTWIKEHGATGKSLATAIVEEAMDQLRGEGVDANSQLVQLIATAAERQLAAGGGASIPGDSDP